MARYGCVITNMKNPVMALYRTDLQIAVGPVLRCVLDWQKHLQRSAEKRWTNKESLVTGWTRRLTCIPHTISFI